MHRWGSSSVCCWSEKGRRKSQQAMKLNCPYRNKVRNKLCRGGGVLFPSGGSRAAVNVVFSNCYGVASTITGSTRLDHVDHLVEKNSKTVQPLTWRNN